MSQGFIRVTGINLGTFTGDPTGGNAGDIYYNKTTNTVRLFNGTAWNDIGSGAVLSASAPSVVSVTPSQGNISSLSQTFVFTFSETMNTTTDHLQPGWVNSIANPANYVFSSGSGTVNITGVTTTSTTASVTTNGSNVTSGDSVNITATTKLQSAAGIPLPAAVTDTYSYVFVSPTSAPTILSWSPVAGTVSTVPTSVQATFSKTMNTVSTSDAGSVLNKSNWSIQATSGSVQVDPANPITISGNTVTIPITSSGIVSGSPITIAAQNTITDSTGNAISGALTNGYTYTVASTGGTTTGGTTVTGNFLASQEGGRKPGPNYTLNLDTTLTTKSCKNETFGVVLQLTATQNTVLGATNLPAGVSLTWYKMLPMNITTASIIAGPTGTHYDPLLPIGNTYTVAAAGTAETAWLWCDITVSSAVTAGNKSFTLTAGGNSIPVTHTVWNYTMPTNPTFAMMMPIYPYEIALSHYHRYDSAEAALGEKYSAMMNAHRMAAFNQYEAPPVLKNTSDPSQGLNLDLPTNQGFNLTNKPYTLGAPLMLPITSAYLTDGSANQYKWNSDSQIQALEASLNNELLSYRSNHWNYYIDEPQWTAVPSLEANLVTELTHIKTLAPHAKIMMTSEIRSAFVGTGPGGVDLVDIWCPIMSFIGQSGHTTIANYAGKTLWLYGACLSHGGCDGSQYFPDGSPDLMVDRESYHALAYALVPYAMGATGSFYYKTTITAYRWDGVVGSSTDPLVNTLEFGGNGDGTLVYPGRTGSNGLTVDQPIFSIRLKNMREGLYLIDMLHAAGKSGTDLATDGITWRQTYADYMAYRDMLGGMLNGGAYVAPAAAKPGEFYATKCQSVSGKNAVTVMPPSNKLAFPTSAELYASTTAGGPYTRKCDTNVGPFTRGSTFTLNDTATAGAVDKTPYYYKVKAINGTQYSWSEVEVSATFSSAPSTGPSTIAGITLWYAADMGVTKDASNNVSGWADQSGTNYNLSQATTSHKPLYVANAYRSNPCLRFAGSGTAGTSVSTWQSLDSSSTQLSPTVQNITLFAVFKPGDATTVMSFFNDMAGTNFFLSTNHNGKLFSTGALSGAIDSTAAATATLQLVAYSSSPTTTAVGKIYVDGVIDKTSAGNSDYPLLHWVRVGAGNNNGGFGAPAAYWFTGDICEIIAYNNVLSTSDFNTVTSYLKTKWGIT